MTPLRCAFAGSFFPWRGLAQDPDFAKCATRILLALYTKKRIKETTFISPDVAHVLYANAMRVT